MVVGMLRMSRLLILIALVALGFRGAAAQDSVDTQVRSMIEKIQSQSSETQRGDLAQRLSLFMIDTLEPNNEVIQVDTIDALSRLLEDQSDEVRFWAAGALQHCGPAAVRAVPRLLAALQEAEFGGSVNRSGSSTSADSISATLIKLKVCVPTPGPDLRGRCNYLVRGRH
jgi:hypothetical protein